jgi:hypothetical protein
MAFDGYGSRTPTSALTRARTVYIDSVAGNDSTGDGSQSKPWRTLQRGWYERMQYVDLRQPFTIQLLGTGPYLIDFPMGASWCTGPEGRFQVLGDPLAGVNIIASGTATGDFSGNVLPTSAIVGTHTYAWLRITSGNCAGSVFLMLTNDAGSVTVANRTARDVNGAVANGDTWQIIEPFTQIQMAATVVGPESGPNINGLQGSYSGNNSFQVQPCHWFYGINFTGANNVRPQSSRLGLAFCRFSTTCVAQESDLLLGGPSENSKLPGAANFRLYGAGVVFNATCNYIGCAVRGVVSNSSFCSIGGSTRFFWGGGRIGHPTANSLSVLQSTFEPFGSPSELRHLGSTIDVGAGGLARVGANWVSLVTLGSCARVQRFGELVCDGAWTGGTTDPAGYGVDVRSGGRALFRNVTPQVTGGTPGSDLRTTNVPVAANSALNANGNAVGNATDALLGEVLARVA